MEKYLKNIFVKVPEYKHKYLVIYCIGLLYYISFSGDNKMIIDKMIKEIKKQNYVIKDKKIDELVDEISGSDYTEEDLMAYERELITLTDYRMNIPDIDSYINILVNNNYYDFEYRRNRFLIQLLGMVRCLKAETVTIQEAEKVFFKPHFFVILTKIHGYKDIADIIMSGCELEDIESLMPDELGNELDEIQNRILVLLSK